MEQLSRRYSLFRAKNRCSGTDGDTRHDIDIVHRTRRVDNVDTVLCNAFSSDGVYTALLVSTEPLGAF